MIHELLIRETKIIHAGSAYEISVNFVYQLSDDRHWNSGSLTIYFDIKDIDAQIIDIRSNPELEKENRRIACEAILTSIGIEHLKEAAKIQYEYFLVNNT